VSGCTIGGIGIGADKREEGAWMKQAINACKDDGIRVSTTPCHGPMDILRLVMHGVDVVDTDYPITLARQGKALRFILNDSTVGRAAGSRPASSSCVEPCAPILNLRDKRFADDERPLGDPAEVGQGMKESLSDDDDDDDQSAQGASSRADYGPKDEDLLSVKVATEMPPDTFVPAESLSPPPSAD